VSHGDLERQGPTSFGQGAGNKLVLNGKRKQKLIGPTKKKKRHGNVKNVEYPKKPRKREENRGNCENIFCLGEEGG